MSANPLPLSLIVDLTIITASPQVASPTYNRGLVIGNSGVIPSSGVNPRVRIYLYATWSSSMINDGFSTSSPEYICAQMYFSQSPPPQSIAVGCQDPTAIGAASVATGGTGYVVGDQVTVVQSGASNGVLQVTAAPSGVVTGVALIVGKQGKNYTVASSLATTGGTGSGLEVNITAIGETCLQAAMACRSVNGTWYPFMVTTAQSADNIALSSWAQSQVGTTYLGNSQEANVLNGIANNTFAQIFGANNSRTWMQYATTQGDLYPNQIYFTASVMGCLMANNTQLANSAYTAKFSAGVPLVGVYTEPLDNTQIQNIEGTVAAQGPNGNLYLNYADAFNVLEQGTMMAPGVFWDQVLGLDILATNIQYNIMNLLTSVPKVPQTDAGQQLLVQAVEAALNQAVTVGFIASSGIWQGQPINVGTGLVTGQSLPSGYLVLTPKYSQVSQASIAARQAPPIYVALIEAGAVHFVTIAVMVQV
ncbi:MAG TPA: DUF3383 family protein [Candidatus Saccharimonadales bacterium]